MTISTPSERFVRACTSLQGLSVGDALGEQFFLTFDLTMRLTRAGLLPGPPYIIEDEFVMALLHE